MRFRFGVAFKDGKLRVSRKTDAVPEPEPAKAHDHTLDFSDTQWKVGKPDPVLKAIMEIPSQSSAALLKELQEQSTQQQQFNRQIQQIQQRGLQVQQQLQQRGLLPPSTGVITPSPLVLEQETQGGCIRAVEKVCFFLSHHFNVEMTATEKNEFWRIGSEHGDEYSIGASRLAAASRSWQSRAQLYSDLLNGHHDVAPEKPAKPVIAPRQAAARWKPPKIRSEGS